jgi:hypothetical protein
VLSSIGTIEERFEGARLQPQLRPHLSTLKYRYLNGAPCQPMNHGNSPPEDSSALPQNRDIRSASVAIRMTGIDTHSVTRTQPACGPSALLPSTACRRRVPTGTLSLSALRRADPKRDACRRR